MDQVAAATTEPFGCACGVGIPEAFCGGLFRLHRMYRVFADAPERMTCTTTMQPWIDHTKSPIPQHRVFRAPVHPWVRIPELAVWMGFNDLKPTVGFPFDTVMPRDSHAVLWVFREVTETLSFRPDILSGKVLWFCVSGGRRTLFLQNSPDYGCVLWKMG